MRRYVSTTLSRRRAELMPKSQARSEVKATPTSQRTLAEQIVKLIRQNPAFASDAEYDRIVQLIEQYTQEIRGNA